MKLNDKTVICDNCLEPMQKYDGELGKGYICKVPFCMFYNAVVLEEDIE